MVAAQKGEAQSLPFPVPSKRGRPPLGGSCTGMAFAQQRTLPGSCMLPPNGLLSHVQQPCRSPHALA